MGAGVDASRCGHLQCASCTGEVVSSVDGDKRLVETGFDAVFDNDIVVLGKRGEVVEFAIVDAIGTCTDDNPCDFGQFECLRKNLLQPFQRSIGV